MQISPGATPAVFCCDPAGPASALAGSSQRCPSASFRPPVGIGSLSPKLDPNSKLFFLFCQQLDDPGDSAAREARLERELKPDSERELELSCRNAADPLRQRGHPRQMVAVGILCGRLAHEPWRAFSMLAALQVTGLDGGARKARGAARAALFGERGRRCQGADGRRRRWRYFDRHSAPPATAGAQEQEHAQAEAHEERGHRQHFDRDLCCPPRQAKNAIAAPRHDGSRLEGSCSAQGSNWRKGGA